MKKIYLATLFFLSLLTRAQELSLDWAFTTGADVQDFGKAIVSDIEGNTYITGDFRGTVDFDPSNDVLSLTALGSDDIFIMKLDVSGKLDWVKSLSGTESESSNSIAIDSEGNIYITGSFWGPTDFDPGESEFILNSNGSDDVFIVKLDNTGNLVWAKSVGSSDVNSRDTGVTILIDQNDEPILTGYFYETVDFDPGPGTYFLSAKSSFWEDTFVLKLSKDGDFMWAKSFGGNELDIPRDMALDQDDNIFITGYFQGTTDLDPGIGQSIYESEIHRYFVLKLDNLGNFEWSNSYDCISGYGITVSSKGDVFVTGSFAKSMTYPEINQTIQSNGEQDAFINKFDIEGNLIWSKGIGSTEDDVGRSITHDNEGHIWVTGYFENTLDLMGFSNLVSNGGSDIFLIRIDSDGEILNSVSFGGSSFEYDGHTFIDNNLSVYVTGWFSDNFNVNIEGNNFNSTSKGSQDIFSIKLSLENSVLGIGNAPKLLVYPNPITNRFTIVSDDPTEKVSLLSMDGKVLETWNGENSVFHMPKNIYSGLYIVQITCNNNAKFSQVLIKD